MSDVKTQAEKLDGWELDGEKLKKTFKFDKYLEGIAFVQKLGVYAESQQHHPGISINHTNVSVTWTTFSKKELTEKDIAGAKSTDNVLKA